MAIPRIALATAAILLGSLMMIASAGATRVAREADITTLRLGQRIQVDDGSCPAGQIKEVVGVALTATGVTRSSSCVPRSGARR